MLQQRTLLSVDPGKTGAIATFSNGDLRGIHDPVAESLSRPFADLLLDCLDFRHHVTVVIEKVNGVPGQSGPASFNFGKGFGELLGVCIGLGIEPVLITPATWKWKIGLSKGMLSTSEYKRLSVQLAAERWPRTDFFKLAKHDGRAEAALLGAYYLDEQRKAA